VPATLACLHHLEASFLGTARAPFEAAGLRLDERRLARGDALPALDEVDGILTLGGAQSARDADGDAVLGAERALLAEAVAAEVPVLGVCLGAQLLASALGGQVVKDARRTVAWRELHHLPAGADDPLVGALSEPVPALHWNEDVFSLPPGAVELLGQAGEGVEAFRAGTCAWGVQFHPDVDAPALDGWYAAYGAWLAEAGSSEREARAADARHFPAHLAAAERLFAAFASVVRERAVGG